MLVVTSQIHAKHSAEVKSTNQDVVITLHQQGGHIATVGCVLQTN